MLPHRCCVINHPKPDTIPESLHLDDVRALDWGIVQRIIPKIRGFKGHLAESLKELLEEFDNVGADQSASIMRRWLDDGVSDDEFLEGTDPRLALARI